MNNEKNGGDKVFAPWHVALFRWINIHANNFYLITADGLDFPVSCVAQVAQFDIQHYEEMATNEQFLAFLYHELGADTWACDIGYEEIDDVFLINAKVPISIQPFDNEIRHIYLYEGGATTLG